MLGWRPGVVRAACEGAKAARAGPSASKVGTYAPPYPTCLGKVVILSRMDALSARVAPAEAALGASLDRIEALIGAL